MQPDRRAASARINQSLTTLSRRRCSLTTVIHNSSTRTSHTCSSTHSPLIATPTDRLCPMDPSQQPANLVELLRAKHPLDPASVNDRQKGWTKRAELVSAYSNGRCNAAQLLDSRAVALCSLLLWRQCDALAVPFVDRRRHSTDIGARAAGGARSWTAAASCKCISADAERHGGAAQGKAV